jgi:hypothetical protein
MDKQDRGRAPRARASHPATQAVPARQTGQGDRGQRLTASGRHRLGCPLRFSGGASADPRGQAVACQAWDTSRHALPGGRRGEDGTRLTRYLWLWERTTISSFNKNLVASSYQK